MVDPMDIPIEWQPEYDAQYNLSTFPGSPAYDMAEFAQSERAIKQWRSGFTPRYRSLYILGFSEWDLTTANDPLPAGHRAFQQWPYRHWSTEYDAIGEPV